MHMQALSTFLAVCVTLYLLSKLYFTLTASDRSIPGPWLTRVSRLWYFNKVRSGSFHHENIALHETYGPIVRVAPGYYSISMTDKTIYGVSSKFAKGDWYQGWKHPSPEKWALFSDQNMKRHSETRKRFQNLYSMSSLLSYETYVDQCVDKFVGRLNGFAQNENTVDFVHWFQCYAFDVIGMITYSQRFGFLDHGEDVAGMIGALDKSMVYSTLAGIFPRLHPYLYSFLEKLPTSGAAGRTYLMNFVQQQIDNRMKAREAGYASETHELASESIDSLSPQDFLDKMTDFKKRAPEKVTPYHIFMMGVSNIIAGSDTTAVSLSSVLYHLVTSPHALTKLREEVTQHSVNPKVRITFKDSQQMPYLQAVIKEALRMHPATGLPLWRVVPEGGAQIAGTLLPAGTNVGINSWVAHYDRNVYGDDVHTFRPERWLEAKEDTIRLQAMEANYMPFGLGSRTCIGRHISTLEMCKLIPELVMRFNFSLAMPKDEWKTINYWFVKPEKLPITLSPRSPV